LFIIKFILIVFLVALILVGILVFTVFSKVNNARKQFRENAARPRNVNGQAVTDTRSPEEVNRKIIPDNEGEYVDYEDA
jgi:flagellar basal body-associated protein FliL